MRCPACLEPAVYVAPPDPPMLWCPNRCVDSLATMSGFMLGRYVRLVDSHPLATFRKTSEPPR